MEDSSSSLAKLATALVEAQKEFAPLTKSATNPHFRNKFVPLSEVVQNAMPVLTKHGLSVTQLPVSQDGEPALRTILMHTSGEFLAGTMPLLAAKRDPQGQGSALSYARRYALMSTLGLVGDEDDDGTAATSVEERRVTKMSSTGAPLEYGPPSALEKAKADLRTAVKSAGLTAEQASAYAWVKDATDADIDQINGLTEALKLGKVVTTKE